MRSKLSIHAQLAPLLLGHTVEQSQEKWGERKVRATQLLQGCTPLPCSRPAVTGQVFKTWTFEGHFRSIAQASKTLKWQYTENLHIHLKTYPTFTSTLPQESLPLFVPELNPLL